MVAGTEPFSLPLLPKMDRNARLSDGAHVFLVKVAGEVEAVLDSPPRRSCAGVGSPRREFFFNGSVNVNLSSIE